MSYRAYCGPRGSDVPVALEKGQALYKEFESLDDALGWARHLDQCGQTTLLIVGDDGTRLTKQEIAATLHHPQYAQHGKPAA
jgi:hypothetical protein